MKRSRYVVKAPSHDGQSNIFYNLRNGLGIKIAKDLADSFEELTEIKALHSSLDKHHFYQQPDEADSMIAEYERAREQLPFHLVIMPHENCNFRCVYCYEKFEKNKMAPEVEAGLIAMVEERLSQGRHKVFTVSWFGGEPLLATDVIERLSIRFRELCERYGVFYVASITTNGYLLDDETLDMLLRNRVKSFQISLDGIEEYHDQQRLLKGGQPTYKRIVENLERMSRHSEPFRTIVRMNVGPENLKHVESHIAQMKQRLGHDPRFSLYFHNIGHWGGENDDQVEICEENMAVKLINQTMDYEMNGVLAADLLRPNEACYAASPTSFVIGTDGMVYKCTIALYDERNHVGQLHPDGSMELSDELMELWTGSGLKDEGCKQCFFAPSCHGDSCPWVRIDAGRRPCPSIKSKVREVVTLMDRQKHPFAEIKPQVEAGV